MKKLLLALMIAALLCPAAAAEAKSKADYTLPTKGRTVLQNIPDRDIAVQAAAEARDTVAGESPVTGLPWEGTYLPMLAQIGNLTDTVKVNGRDVKASGIGKNTPWGLQYADIVYEEMATDSGSTRFTALFSDCFAQGQPADGIGPLRSCRIGALYLREEWQSGLVYGGGFAGTFGWRDQTTAQFLSDHKLLEQGVLFNTLTAKYHRLGYRVKSVKAPNNFNIDLIALRNLIPDTYVSTPHPFLFSDGGYYADGYEAAGTVNLDWGYKYNISHFVYDEAANAYVRYCGAGMNADKWAPFTAFASAQDRSEENRQQLSFANVIIQRVSYEYEGGSGARLNTESVGRGNADIFIDGVYIPGYWVRASLSEPTVFYDDQGNELRLNRGKTFIAHFPAERLCTFGDEV